MSGEILGSISVRKESIVKALLKSPYAVKYIELFFTPNRLIVAKTAGGWKTGGIAGIPFAKRNAKKLSLLSPEAILKADEKNFAIPYSDIIEVEMKKGILSGKIKIFTGTKKYEFNIEKRKFENHLNFVRSVLPGKLRL